MGVTHEPAYATPADWYATSKLSYATRILVYVAYTSSYAMPAD